MRPTDSDEVLQLCRPVLDYAFVMDIDCLHALHTEQHLILSGSTAIMTTQLLVILCTDTCLYA